MKIGIALGGGGARGFAHVGVLRALEQAGITIDCVSGTSIGALVGAVYLSGNLEQLVKAAAEIKLTDLPLLLSPSWSLAGVFSGKNVLEMLSDFLSVDNIEELGKPFAAISTDLAHSEIVTFTTGDLRTAIRASISIPAVFTPVQSGERILVDGGTLEPVPVSACRSLGADFVIAVDLFGAYPETDASLCAGGSVLGYFPNAVSSALGYLRQLPGKITKGTQQKSPENSRAVNIMDVVEKTLSVSQQHLTLARMREHPAEVVIMPALSKVNLLDFHRGAPIIEVGNAAALKVIPELLLKLEKARNERTGRGT